MRGRPADHFAAAVSPCERTTPPDEAPGARRRFNQRIRIFHLDDDRAFCELVRFWLSEHDDVAHVGAAVDVDTALAELPRARPDVILLDSMASTDDQPIDVLAALRAAAPGARIVLYTGFPEDMARRRLSGPVDGYVEKAPDEDALLTALRSLGLT